MSVVAAVMARSYTPDMFADLTAVVHARAFDKPSGVTTLTFAGALADDLIAAIRARMESRDDADQEARANLRALCQAVIDDPDASDAVKAAVCGVITYALGE